MLDLWKINAWEDDTIVESKSSCKCWVENTQLRKCCRRQAKRCSCVTSFGECSRQVMQKKKVKLCLRLREPCQQRKRITKRVIWGRVGLKANYDNDKIMVLHSGKVTNTVFLFLECAFVSVCGNIRFKYSSFVIIQESSLFWSMLAFLSFGIWIFWVIFEHFVNQWNVFLYILNKENNSWFHAVDSISMQLSLITTTAIIIITIIKI